MTTMTATEPTTTHDATAQLAVGELLEVMRCEILGYARRRVGANRAEEILSDVFEAALRAAQSHREVTPAWLMTVARNKVIDHWRRTERESRLIDRLTAECPVFSTAEFIPGESEVGVTLGHLQPRYRSILVRHYVLGETLGSMADDDGVSYQAMESAMARARRTFRHQHSAA